MNSNIIFRMVAYTDAAGKFSVDAPRNGNEDNFFFAYDLSKDAPSKGEPDVNTPMSDCGLLMVVADGMGGMNAGEVASQIAVDTVAEFFAPGKINSDLAKDHQKRKNYMEHVIREADVRIKKDSKHDTEHKGMGSTIIMAWIVGDELTLSWCGDSRAYRYNPAGGIEPLSKDHSYVQELVDKGLIKYEDTFDHPQGNIVTRSLGDVSKKAIPETELFKVYNDDIILLCSDGLSGVLRDKKTYDMDGELIEGDNLEDIIRANHKSLKECREALWKAAEKADWYDNVTAVLCEIRSGASNYVPPKETVKKSDDGKTSSNSLNKSFKGINIRLSTRGIIISVLAFIIIAASIFYAAWELFSRNQVNKHQEELIVDSINNVPQETIPENNLEFINKQTTLKLRIGKLANKLEIPSTDNVITQLINLADNANDTTKLNNIEKEVILWELKAPYLREIRRVIKQNTSNSKLIKSLRELYSAISSAKVINGTEWDKKLNEIVVKHTPGKVEVKKDVKNEEIDPLPVTDADYKTHYGTIGPDDSYGGIIGFLEKEYPGYYVSIIKDQETGWTLFNRKERRPVLVPIGNAVGHQVEITLLPKK